MAVPGTLKKSWVWPLIRKSPPSYGSSDKFNKNVIFVSNNKLSETSSCSPYLPLISDAYSLYNNSSQLLAGNVVNPKE